MRRLLAIPVASALLAGALVPALASQPPSGTVTVPTSGGQRDADSWTGTIPPGTNPTSSCSGFEDGADEHDVTVKVPAGTYDKVEATFAFSISWDPASSDETTSDEILTVESSTGKELGSSDGGSTTEKVVLRNLRPGTYKVFACGFANILPQPYKGKVVVTTRARNRQGNLPSGPTHGLRFGAATTADLQRDEAEPLVEVAKDGHVYTCGPTGFSNAADYAQVSTDHGDQFHLLGTPPRGQQGTGGGGDCGIALGTARNTQGNYQYAYAGLGPLTGFSTATSPDNGHSITPGGPPIQGGATSEGGGADRQWLTFVGASKVLLIYNQQEPRNVVVLNSTDGGLTYSPDAVVAAHDPEFPGPIHYDGRHNLVYFAWTAQVGSAYYVNLAVSHDKGTTWQDCVAVKGPADMSTSFPVADNDRQGNLYIAYTEQKNYHTYLVTLRQDEIKNCKEPTSDYPTHNPGFSAPLVMDRGKVNTTVFPWLTAEGKPGRVAVAFYGTRSDGNPNKGTFKASWDVYVSQSLNALAPDPDVAQVKVTTHPFHFGSICLEGLGCDLSHPPGDRSLADFFAIDYNRADGRLYVVYNRTNKKPGEAAGHVATPMVASQIGGPSNGGGRIDVDRRIVTTKRRDPTGDALASYSSWGDTAHPTNEPAADLTRVSVGPAVDPRTGTPLSGGGVTVRMHVADLSDAALQQAMSDTLSGSLLWIFRFTNGYQDAGASARYDTANGFTFGFNDYSTGQTPCAGTAGQQDGDKCVIYPGDKRIRGHVSQSRGDITLTIPLRYLKALEGSEGPGRVPDQVPATIGSRLYDAAAFSVGNASADPSTQSFMYPLDNTPAFDLRIRQAKFSSKLCDSRNALRGSPGRDVIEGTRHDDIICGFGGADTLVGHGGNDIIIGGSGADTLKGGSGLDTLIGGAGRDTARGGSGRDLLIGKGGNDVLIGGSGADTVKGNRGWDTLRGVDNGDSLQGGRGNDSILGGRGDDVLRGFTGADLLDGGGGHDICYPGAGRDRTRSCEG